MWRSYSDNCFICGVEHPILDLHIIADRQYKACNNCMKIASIHKEYSEVKQIVNQYLKFGQMQMDPELASPSISVEPLDSAVQKAVELLKTKNPQYFVGVRKIIVDTGSAFGFVESGPNKDPAVIHINLQKIKSELQSRIGGIPQDQFEKELVRQIALTIAHERGHIKSFSPEQGFVGGENPAINEENSMQNKLK